MEEIGNSNFKCIQHIKSVVHAIVIKKMHFLSSSRVCSHELLFQYMFLSVKIYDARKI